MAAHFNFTSFLSRTFFSSWPLLFLQPGCFGLRFVYSTYCTVDDAYAIVNSLGSGALMSKIDLKNAFWLIPVCPQDWNLLGMCWRGKFYIDTFLPFGLRSAIQPTVYSHPLDLAAQIFHPTFAALSRFFTAGTPGSQECSNNLSNMLTVCQRINAPVKPSKTEAHNSSHIPGYTN